MSKSQITASDVVKVAKLANLNLTSTELEKFTPQLAEIFNFIGQLDQVVTDNIFPTTNVNNLNNVTRTDAIDEDRVLEQAAAVDQSSRIKKNLFVVKAVIDNN